MIAIEVKNLAKMFKLYPSQGSRFIDYLTFGKRKQYQEFWALRDISFFVQKGNTFGILGQNGSGKSTLLSILAGVLEPSGGSFLVNGRVSAILELGAGFHPDFTGRANIYMYGSIMGLSKELIDKRLPDIIHFSELGDFIDQPLRTFSSGMYARLAFSVAVNVDADILIIDEALAVGDALFQHRCFRKIHELKESGKTILYVGHDTEAVRSLCDHAMILDGGKMLSIGESARVSNEYLALIAEREQKYYEANLQEYGEKLDKNWMTVFDFIDHFADAEKKMVYPEYIREMNIEVRSSPRKTIFAHPPSELSYWVTIERGSVLAFAIGIYPSVYEMIPEGVKFRIFINEKEIFSRILEPKKNPSDRGWHNHMIDISGFAGRKVLFHYITEGSGQDLSYCWAGWGWMKIVSKMYKEPNNNSIKIKESGEEVNIQDTGVISIHNNIMKKIDIQNNIIEIGNKKVIIENVVIKNSNGEVCSGFISGEKIIVEVIIYANQTVNQEFFVGSVLYNKYTRIAGSNTHHKKCNIISIKRGEKFKIIFIYDGILRHGIYSITIGIGIFSNNQNYEIIERFHRLDEKYYFNIISDNMCDGIVDICEEIIVKKINNTE